LAELAKLVQGRPNSAAASFGRSTNGRVPANGNGGSAPPSGMDLETELLNDLQASFAAVRQALPQGTITPRSQQPAARGPIAEALPPTFTAPPERAPVAPFPPPPAARTELREEFRPAPFDEGRFVPIPQPPVSPAAFQTQQAAPAFQRERRAEPPLMERAEPPRQSRQAAPQPPVADLYEMPLRGSSAPMASAPAAPARQPHSRWDNPTHTAVPKNRFAPPPAPAQAYEETEEVLDPFADGGLYADPPDILGAQEEQEQEYPLEDIGTTSETADDEFLPPLDEGAGVTVGKRRSRGNLYAVLGVLAIAAVGGAAFALFSSRDAAGPDGTPPVIAADHTPNKVAPADTAAVNDSDTPNKLIYDRVNSGANDNTKLVTSADNTIKDVGAPTAANNAITRVIIPGGPGVDQPTATDDALRLDGQDAVTPAATSGAEAASEPVTAGGNSVLANETADSEGAGPRKVRTVVVKPDGTIVSSEATDASDAVAAEAQSPAATDAPAAAAPAPVVVPVPSPPAATATAPSTADDTAAISGNKGAALAITPDATVPAEPDPVPPATDSAPQATVAQPAPAVVPIPAPAKPAKNTQVAQADDTQPLDVTPSASVPAAAPAGGVFVQISSQRTEDAARATYKDLQQRYPNILGAYDVNIQRADVPDRGTFFRVRVGPFSPGDGQRLCDDLRSAGGDCVLAKR
jgi:hypothetical protein